MKTTFPKTSTSDAMQLLTSAWSELSEATIKNCFRKVEISEKSAEEAINDQDDLLKDLAAEELEETINEFRERLRDDVPEELNAAVVLDIDVELSANRGKPIDAEILAEVRGETMQEEDGIDVVYDEPPAPPSAFGVEKTNEFFNSLYFFATKKKICEKFYQK